MSSSVSRCKNFERSCHRRVRNKYRQLHLTTVGMIPRTFHPNRGASSLHASAKFCWSYTLGRPGTVSFLMNPVTDTSCCLLSSVGTKLLLPLLPRSAGEYSATNAGIALLSTKQARYPGPSPRATGIGMFSFTTSIRIYRSRGYVN